MYTRRVTWTRPNNTVDWPWVGLDTAYMEALPHMPGFIRWYLEEASDTTFIMAYVWQTQEDWYNHSLQPVTISVIENQAPLMIERNITKTIVEEII